MTNSETVKIKYTLAMPKPSSHYFEVGLEISGLKESHADFILPAWRPGRYFIFDFPSGVQEFSAKDGNDIPLQWHKIDKYTWHIESNNKKRLNKINIYYKVYADEFENRTRGLDEEHAFVNGTAVFMYSEKYRKARLTLQVIPYKNWHVTTGLDNLKGKAFEFTAPNYDYFVDCPLEIGNQADYSFNVDGKEHVISFFGKANYDIEKLKKDFSEIIKKNYEFWGKAPYKKYVFIIHCTPKSSGGTEHINSTVLGIKPSSFDDAESYKHILSLVSHEFFHTWNVKQFRPKGITPYDYTKENYTEELWIAEGGTSYYDGLMILRTGQITKEDFFKEISGYIKDERTRPGNKIQSLAESSFDAWVKFWRRNENAYISQSDYYKKGSYVSLILDLEIRQASGNEYSLDDVYRTMFEKFPAGKGYTNDDFIKVCEKSARRSLKSFFDDYLYGTKQVDWEKYLLYAGLNITEEESAAQLKTGIVISNFEGKVFVSNVLPGSLAEKEGLNMEDEIIAIDGIKADYQTSEAKLTELKPGEEVNLVLFHDKELKKVTLRQSSGNETNYRIEKISNPTELQKSIFESWLDVKWG
jgi:predicted metalloprotease with PDZ domain